MARVHWNGKRDGASYAAKKNALAALLDIANQWKTGKSAHYEAAAHSAHIEALDGMVERLTAETKELEVKLAQKREELIEARAALTEAYNG